MRRRWVRAILLALAVATIPSVAEASFGIVPDSFSGAALDGTDNLEVRAGAHPDRFVTRFTFTTLPDGGADGNVKDVMIDLPAGFVGDPNAAPFCPREDFQRGRCEPRHQVGTMHATFGSSDQTLAVYNVKPREDEIAEFGVFVLLFPIRIYVSVRSDGDYGTRMELRDIPQNLPLTAAEVELWGIPADHQTGTGIPRRALLTNPTSCEAGASATVLQVRSWQRPQKWVSAAAPIGPFTACDELPFQPALALDLDMPVADSPSGVSMELTVPQHEAPDERASSHLKDVAVTLPAGLTLSPGVADGLAACDAPPSCPSTSKIGTIELRTPLLSDPLRGEVFLGRALGSANFRLFGTARGRGASVALSGALQPDPETGRLFVALSGLPALPFSVLRLHLKDGARAPLATPARCGPGAGTAVVTPWRGGPPARLPARIEVPRGPNGDCPVSLPFAPRLTAGSSPATAGASAPFAMTLRRADGEQTLDRMELSLPPGLSARLADVPRCSDAAAAAASCPPGSLIGSVAAEAGAGALPLPLRGDAYLTGPHRGSPFGFALVLRAQAGPLDLGTTVVRAGVRLDPTNAHLTVETDRLPRIIAGVPLRLRMLALDVDRPRFMRNPTSCATKSVVASVTSLEHRSAQSSVRYAVGRCGRLRFAPQVALALGPRAELRDGGRPRVTIALRPRPRDAAVREVDVELPNGLALDAAAVSLVCTQRRAREGRCPPQSAVGSVRAGTPLLATTLRGRVHIVEPRTGTRPEVWATLRGEGLRLSVRGVISGAGGGPVAARFLELPDIPLERFTLRLRGGRTGLLQLTRGLCRSGAARSLSGVAVLQAWNGAGRSLAPAVAARPACRP